MQFKSILFFILPVLRFKVEEESMVPNLTPGTIVLVNKLSYLFRNPSVGDVVVLYKENKSLTKRINKVKNNLYFVKGDNVENSTDSRHFGWVEKKEIIGKVFIR